MITVLHHIAFSLLLRSFNLSSFADQSWYLLNQTSFAVLSDVINDSYNYGKQVCLFLEGCGLINYIFIVVFLLRLTHSTYFFFSNRGSPFILNVIIQFLYSSLLPVINKKYTYFLLFITNREINTLDIEYKSSLLRGNG
jgi:hypothetical protein